MIETARANGRPLAALAGEPLTALELDVLAAAVAPEAEPRLGWTFQSLQTGTPQPYPTPALLQELLALDATLAGQLYAALAEGAPLRRSGLVQVEDDGPVPARAPRPRRDRAPAWDGRIRPPRRWARRGSRSAPPGTS